MSYQQDTPSVDSTEEEALRRHIARLQDWIANGVPTAARCPPWQPTLDRIDAEQTAKVLRVLNRRPGK